MPVSTSLALANSESAITGVTPAGKAARAQEHSERLAICLSTSADREWVWNMSDPRYTDPFGNDLSRRSGVQRSSTAGTFWPWMTGALTALGTIVGLLIGYNWGAEHEKRAQSGPPTTTGSAPPQRPAPPGKFGNMPAPPSAPNQSPR
jgi:hypothetical protein